MEISGKYSMNRVFSGLAVLCSVVFSLSSSMIMMNARTPIPRDELNDPTGGIPYFSITALLGAFIGICLEWFLYGKISVVCFTYTLPMESNYYSPIKDSIPEYSSCI